MTTFFIDLWHDLREKRLWPVAVGLLAAMAAVPVVLFKPAGEVSLPPTVATNASVPELLPVVSIDTGPTHGSKLESFDQKNPFHPLNDLPKAAPAVAAATAAPAPGASTGSSSTGGPLGGVAGSPGGSGSGRSGGSSTTSTQYFRYTIDVSLGERGKGKAATIKGVKQTQLLPDGNAPLLAYMGLAADAKTAVFFIIDPAYTAQGEGTCRPKGADCRFVYLGLNEDGNEESIFTTDGTSEFTLKLLKINRESISSSQAKGDSTDTKAAPKSASKKASKPAASKDIPSLLDLPSLLAERR
ncbi:MAG: hypothetical protein QOE08_1419 [Thermoleophilaceae bacterium]|nr:hypothetical protein [Thermoleophilaceae bacterium]